MNDRALPDMHLSSNHVYGEKKTQQKQNNKAKQNRPTKQRTNAVVLFTNSPYSKHTVWEFLLKLKTSNEVTLHFFAEIFNFLFDPICFHQTIFLLRCKCATRVSDQMNNLKRKAREVTKCLILDH
jgi:hypothetical protein